MITNTNNNSFEKDYLYIKKVITICFEKSYRLSHSECDMIFNFLYPCGWECVSNTNVLSLQQLEKMEEIKQLLKENKSIIPKCYNYNYF